jgi:hypothetical protein
VRVHVFVADWQARREWRKQTAAMMNCPEIIRFKPLKSGS